MQNVLLIAADDYANLRARIVAVIDDVDALSERGALAPSEAQALLSRTEAALECFEVMAERSNELLAVCAQPAN